MTPIYFRFIDTYLVYELPNFDLTVKENEVIRIGENEYISYAGYLHTKNGVKAPYLHIFMHVAVNEELISTLFDHRSTLSDIEQTQLDKIGNEKEQNMSIKSQDALRQFRWLTGLLFDVNLRGDYIPLQWSRDRRNWENVPISQGEPNFIIGGFLGHELTTVIDSALISSLFVPNIRKSEPLGHNLLIEAKRLFEHDDIRGAFLLSFSALEVGIKEYIAKRVPEAAWLATNAPSPNVFDLCHIYLPTLDARLDIKKTIVAKLIESYMKSRNALAHRGVFEDKNGKLLENTETVRKKLKVVEYMLYRLDFCLGMERAEHYANLAHEQMVLLGKETVD